MTARPEGHTDSRRPGREMASLSWQLSRSQGGLGVGSEDRLQTFPSQRWTQSTPTPVGNGAQRCGARVAGAEG